ncbi:MAG: diaminopimelate decarboxylase [Paramuribaculum sp.]|nr:diaminopimelate decarboxylase [Paramuribaculum sp.]
MMDFPVELFRGADTPFYYYNLELLRQTLSCIKSSIPAPNFKVHYAMKANANPVILEQINDAGLGIDAVSGGELKAAISAGFDPQKIVFAGVGKTDAEIIYGINTGISAFNVESLPELEVISEIATSLNKTANVAIRVNPNIDAHTHHYITTGLAENKFGINLEQLDSVIEKCNALTGVELIGLHFHIGSQITDNTPFAVLCERINSLQNELEAKGVRLKTINVGGGLGIDYDNPDENPIPDFKSYFEVFSKNLNLRPGQELHFELGRSIVAQCGSLITKVLYVKKGTTKQFAIVDAGMTDLIRPALYQAYHKIDNLSSDGVLEKYDVVGPICESSDVFQENAVLSQVRRGDLLALRSAGAYGEIMASQYNLRRLPGSIAK